MDWIACAERMPELRPTEDGSMEESDYVLAWVYPYGAPAVRLAAGYENVETERAYHVLQLERSDGVTTWNHRRLEDVTHWMPLPAPPKET